MWIGFLCLRTEVAGCFCEHGNELPGFVKGGNLVLKKDRVS
jgi:hypothetical protein